MFKFEDLHDFNGQNNYPCSNEDAQIHKNLIKGFNKADRIGGICGGGDIGFISLLPNVKAKGQLLLIDHSYTSMCGALIKYLILENYSPGEIKKLFTVDGKKLFKIVDEFKKELPEKFQNTNGTILVSKSGPYTGYGLKKDDTYFIAHDLIRIWTDVTEEEIELIQKNLHKITFLHGDLDDLFKKGPFDIIYTSNALTFYGRKSTPTNIEKLKKSLKSGGYVLTTNHSGLIKGFNELKRKNGSPKTSWQYLLLQKPSD